jgi:hypothetical protein
MSTRQQIGRWPETSSPADKMYDEPQTYAP